MRNARRNILIALVAILVLCPAVSFAQESQGCIVTVGNEQLSFTAQPEAGYVVKAQEKAGSSSAFWGALSFLEEKLQIPFNQPNLLKIRGEWEPQACPEQKKPALSVAEGSKGAPWGWSVAGKVLQNCHCEACFAGRGNL